MKKYEKKIIPQKEIEVVSGISCDLCGKEGFQEGWQESYYVIDEPEISVSVRQKEGRNYPDGGWFEEVNIDICPQCFKNTLIPFLKEKGVKIEKNEVDF
jgi:RNA polymerase subunit RPABC4/transcription elongation factor Spt4